MKTGTKQPAVATTTLALFLALASIVSAGETELAALDAFWSEISRTVRAGDFDGYAATYHPDAVLVSEANGKSYPIAEALRGWEQGFKDTRAGKVKASVEFRFTQRLHDASTAHESGMFHYVAEGPDGEVSDQYVHFESLLVWRNGWKMLMEYQKHPATRAEWDEAQ